MTLKEIIEYEWYSMKASFVENIKKIDTWMFFIALIALYFALKTELIIVIVLIILEIVLQSKKNYDSGLVRNFIRKKYGFPSRADIKELKEKNINSEQF